MMEESEALETDVVIHELQGIFSKLQKMLGKLLYTQVTQTTTSAEADKKVYETCEKDIKNEVRSLSIMAREEERGR